MTDDPMAAQKQPFTGGGVNVQTLYVQVSIRHVLCF